MRFAEIAIPAPIHTTFTYQVPDGQALLPGMRVLVPFRRRRTVGVCMSLTHRRPERIKEENIREVAQVLDEHPSIGKSVLSLIRWISIYYVAPIGEVVRAALPARLLQIAPPRTLRPAEPMETQPTPSDPVALTHEQAKALDATCAAAGDEKCRVILLEGITGSGKTEIYLRLFEELASQGRQGLLLVPEIGLTPQLTGRAAARFGNKIAVYHSGLTDAQRHMQWMRIQKGDVGIVIGTRSALFVPLPNLGAIVVDEEHDSSYKQDDGVTYSGRDGAIVRATIEGIPVLLGSATPSLESISNAEIGKYRHLKLTKRPTGGFLPTVEIVDMRSIRRIVSNVEVSEGTKRRVELLALSPQLYDAIDRTLARKEQVLLFTGRRGFASSLQCDRCGEVITCPNCDITLTPHKRHGLSNSRSQFALICHYCDYQIFEPPSCPSCSASSLIPIGQGTERLEAELSDFFPKARVARFDSDSASNSSRRKKILDDMRQGKIDILVGTQMVTKGHDFPAITLVGVVSADTILALPDFRSAERTFQLLTQVAGRAGRGNLPGHVIIQTRQPLHASFVAAQNHDIMAFAQEELRHRKMLGYPPFARLANIRISATDEALTSKAARIAADIISQVLASQEKLAKGILLGPAPSPIGKLRGRWRWQILIKSPTANLLANVFSQTFPKLREKIPPKVRFAIDVDPLNLL